LASDDAFLATASAARRVVITDLGRVASEAAYAELNRRMTQAAERNVAVYGTVIPSPQPQTDSFTETLRSGGVMIATNSEAATIGSSTSAAAVRTFPRLLGPMVRDRHLMELKEAVRRSTSLPATVFNIPQRGILRENYFADIVIFDASK